MFRHLISLSLLISGAAGAERPAFVVGAGLEMRMQRELNPDFVEGKSLGQIFAQARFETWAFHTELGQEKRESSSGGLKITAKSTNAGVWGRYHFVNPYHWKPFASAGLGAYFDNVISEFAGASDERGGIRPYFGLGGGISAVFLDYLFVEAEGRAALVRDRKEPTLSGIVRVGVHF